MVVNQQMHTHILLYFAAKIMHAQRVDDVAAKASDLTHLVFDSLINQRKFG